jgi:hypothetical protein
MLQIVRTLEDIKVITALIAIYKEKQIKFLTLVADDTRLTTVDILVVDFYFNAISLHC